MTYLLGTLKKATGNDIAEPTEDDSDLANATDPDNTVLTGTFLRSQGLSTYIFDATKGQTIYVYLTVAKVQDWIDNGGGPSTMLADLADCIEFNHKKEHPVA